MTRKVKARVTGSRAIAGVETGGTVDLDPEVTNVEALIVGGHIKLIPPKATTTVKPEGDV